MKKTTTFFFYSGPCCPFPSFLHPSLPSLFSHLPLFSSPCYFLLRSTPRRAALLGGSPPSAALVPPHAGNNSRPLKNPELLDALASRRTSLRLLLPSPAGAKACSSTCRALTFSHRSCLVGVWRRDIRRTKTMRGFWPKQLHKVGKWMKYDVIDQTQTHFFLSARVCVCVCTFLCSYQLLHLSTPYVDRFSLAMMRC